MKSKIYQYLYRTQKTRQGSTLNQCYLMGINKHLNVHLSSKMKESVTYFIGIQPYFIQCGFFSTRFQNSLLIHDLELVLTPITINITKVTMHFFTLPRMLLRAKGEIVIFAGEALQHYSIFGEAFPSHMVAGNLNLGPCGVLVHGSVCSPPGSHFWSPTKWTLLCLQDRKYRLAFPPSEQGRVVSINSEPFFVCFYV